jgi:hypothetical protein
MAGAPALPAFNQRIRSELMGEPSHVSPATSRDPSNGRMHYAHGNLPHPPIGHVLVPSPPGKQMLPRSSL